MNWIRLSAERRAEIGRTKTRNRSQPARNIAEARA
jgi:hypothetical protein